MKKRLGLGLILSLAFFLRIISLSSYPAGFTADEAAQGYTAYSILKTGRDEWGVKFPLNPRSFGDFKAPLYTYLAIPSIAVFGLNEFAVRLPNAILGALAVLIVYFLALELFKDRKIALLSSLLLAINPWHISISRGAFETSLTTFFLPLAVLLFLLGIKKPRILILSAIIFGLNLFTYHSAKLVTPLIILVLVTWKSNIIFRKNYIAKIVAPFLILSCFFVLTVFSLFSGSGTRAADIGLFSGGWQVVSDTRYFAVLSGLPDIISRIYNNKLTFVSNQFIKTYFSYLSPQFLFTDGVSEATYGMIPGIGLLYLIELPFVLASFFYLFKEKKQEIIILWVWFFLAPIPASLVRGIGYNANRAAIMMPSIQILSAYGFFKTYLLVKKKEIFSKAILVLFPLILFLFFISFLEVYFFQAPVINSKKMNYGWPSVVSLIKDTNKKVVVSRTLSEPQAFIMFYQKMDPSVVQKDIQPWLMYEKEGHNFVDQIGSYNLENYEFRGFSFPEDWSKKGSILIGREEDFSIQEKLIDEKMLKGEITVQKVLYPDNKVAFEIITL